MLRILVLLCLLRLGAQAEPGWQRGAEFRVIQVMKTTPRTPEVQAQIVAGLRVLPERLKEKVFTRGLQIMLVPRVEDYFKSYMAERPVHKLPKSETAFFDPTRNCVVVAEEVPRHRGDPRSTNDFATEVFLHEFGHACDHCFGMPSKQQPFLQVYQQDLSETTAEQRRRASAFSAEGTGPRETFAELLALHYMERLQLPTVHGYILKMFPRTYAYMRGTLSTFDR